MKLFLILTNLIFLVLVSGASSAQLEREFFGQRFSSMEKYVESDTFRSMGGRCGFDRMSAQASARGGAQNLDALQPSSTADCTNSFTRILNEYNLQNVVVIKVWFHVIQQTNGTGSISDSRINAQMTALNEDFLALSGTQGQNGFGTKIRFELEGITRTTNNAWYSDSFNDETAYKTALRRDTSAFLNVYSNDAQGFLGYAYLPPGNAGTFYDGVVILDGSVGGRNNGFSVYDQGRTLTHEVGHYLGLLHTFQGGCSNSFTSGDLVTDTNAEQEPYLNVSASCPSRSTCGNPDPVSNYMDYNRDSCMDRFTSQQSNRMVCSLLNYRPGVVNVVTQQGQVVPLSAIMLLLDS